MPAHYDHFAFRRLVAHLTLEIGQELLLALEHELLRIGRRIIHGVRSRKLSAVVAVMSASMEEQTGDVRNIFSIFLHEGDALESKLVPLRGSGRVVLKRDGEQQALLRNSAR